jgi:hypothetical protein
VVKIDTDTVYVILSDEVAKISTTRSILTAPEILVSGNKGVGMAIAEAGGLRSLAVSFQSELGYVPERMKISLLNEKGAVKVLVSDNGLGGRGPPFRELFVPQPDESIVSVVHRAAANCMSRAGTTLGLEPLKLRALSGHLADWLDRGPRPLRSCARA